MAIELFQIIILFSASIWLITKVLGCLGNIKRMLLIGSIPIAFVVGCSLSVTLLNAEIYTNIKHGFAFLYIFSACSFLLQKSPQIRITTDAKLYILFFIPVMYFAFALLYIVESKLANYKDTTFLVAMLFGMASALATMLPYQRAENYNLKDDISFNFGTFRFGETFIYSFAILTFSAWMLSFAVLELISDIPKDFRGYAAYIHLVMALPIIVSMFHWAARIYGLIKNKALSLEKANLPSLTIHTAAIVPVMIFAS
jgi:hypothetical protein